MAKLTKALAVANAFVNFNRCLENKAEYFLSVKVEFQGWWKIKIKTSETQLWCESTCDLFNS